MGSLDGRTIAFLEARRSQEMAQLVERQGGTPYVAPALREVPTADSAEVHAWIQELVAQRFDVVMLDQCMPEHGRVHALRVAQQFARGVMLLEVKVKSQFRHAVAHLRQHHLANILAGERKGQAGGRRRHSAAGTDRGHGDQPRDRPPAVG